MIAEQLRRVASREEQSEGILKWVGVDLQASGPLTEEEFFRAARAFMFRYGRPEPPLKSPYEIVRPGTGW